MQRYIGLIIFFLSAPIATFAQLADITGLWRGTLYNDSTGQFYKYEIGISKEKGKYTGFSHTWFLMEDKQYYGVKEVKIKIANDGKIIVEDDGLIANNYPVAPSKNVRQLNVLTLDDADSIMTLVGPFTTNRTREYSPLTGHVTLQRKNDFWHSALVPHLQELGRENELSFVKNEREALLASQYRTTRTENSNPAPSNSKVEKVTIPTAAAKLEAEALVKKEWEEKEAKDQATWLQNASVAKKLQDEKEAFAKEQARQTTAQKEMAKQKQEEERLAKKWSEAKTAAEKQLAKEMLARQRQENIDQAKVNKALDEKAAREKEAIAKANKQAIKEAIEKQQELERATTAAKLLADKQTASEALAAKQAEEKAGTDKRMTEIAAAKKSAALLAEQKRLEALTPAAPAAKVNERITVLQQTVTFSSDSLQLALYDNGEVDGDTVSVLLNGTIILAKQGLSTTAVRKTIYIPAGLDKIELVMYAETLGSIPPNTGLLVIRDGKSLYEIRFSGDLQKNASIVFNRKKE